jgi:hypothetical protein
VTTLLAATAWALVGACFQVELTADPSLSDAWRRAVAELASELSGGGPGRCAEVRLRVMPLTRGEGMLEIESADGRTARRRVASPSELRAVALGVLASIPTEPSDVPPEESAAAFEVAEAAESATAALPIPGIADPPRRAAPSPLSSPALLGMTFGTRVGFPTRSVAPELELRGDARLSRWLVSFSGRASVAGTRLNGIDDTTPEESEYTAGALVGPWFAVAGGVLSLGGGPRFGVVIEATDAKSRTRGDVWVELAGRYVFAVGDRWHPTVAFEVDGAPRRMLVAAETAGLSFPTWSAGLRFGIVGGLP